MNLNTRVQCLVDAIAAPISAEQVPGILGLSEPPFDLDGRGLEGFVAGLAAKFPSELPEQFVGTGDEPGPESEWNDFYIGRFRATGDTADLVELVRRARHRDGSSLAIETSTDAGNFLRTVASIGNKQLQERLRAAGYTHRIVYGNFPGPKRAAGRAPASQDAAVGSPAVAETTASEVVEAAAPAAEPAAPVRATPRPPARPAPPPGRAAAPLSAPRVTATADLAEGKVVVGSSRLMIDTAVGMVASITAAVRTLLIPSEGYAWVDDSIDPLSRSALVQLDSVAGEGLPEFDGPGGGLLQGEVTQAPATARYNAKIYDRAGSMTTFGDFAYLSEAKFALAKRVRENLAAEAKSLAV